MPKKTCVAGLVVILLMLVILLTGCELGLERSFRPASDWSRGMLVGSSTLSNPVGLGVDADGGRVHLAWVTEDDRNEALHYAQVNESAEIVVSRNLGIDTTHPVQVQLLPDGRGGAHLFWIESRSGVQGLHYVRVSREGQAASYPAKLSAAETSVDSYHAGFSGEGDIRVYWATAAGDFPGIYRVCLDSWGTLTCPSTLIRAGGLGPHFAVSTDGMLHLTWVEVPEYGQHEVYYAVQNPTKDVLESIAQIGFYSATTGQVGYTPRIGLAGGDVYVIWSVERRGGGLTQPAADSYYVSFPKGRADSATAQQVMVPGTASPHYVKTTGDFNYSALALLEEGETAVLMNSDFIYQAAVASVDRDELPIALATQLSTRARDRVDVTLTIWADGTLKGYQVAARTRSVSLRPSLVVDSAGNFHLAWIDTGGFGTYPVYYATTSPVAKQILNSITTRDVLSGVFNVIWGLGQAASFFPVFVVWLLPPYLWIVVFSFIKTDEDLSRRGAKIAFGIAIFIYIFTKFFLLPSGFMSFVPFVDKVPPPFNELLIFGLPLVVLVIALLCALQYIRRSEGKTLFVAFTIFALVDGALSLLIYVPAYLGA